MLAFLFLSVVPSATKPPEPRTWQSSLKTIIKDKPLLSFIVMVSLMIVLCAIVAVISILTASGKARFRLPVGDGDDNRQNIPQDKDIGTKTCFVLDFLLFTQSYPPCISFSLCPLPNT